MALKLMALIVYHLPHQGKLEYLAQSCAGYTASYTAPQNKFYSTATFPPSFYDDGMFIPSRDQLFYSSSETAKPSLPYFSNHENYILSTPQPEYHFIPDNFLKPGKEGIFVGQAEEVKEFVEKIFEKIFDRLFPNTIKMSILNQEEFRKIAPSPNTIGLSVNRSQEGLLSEIFILNSTLGRVMLTIGHELGHILTKTLSNPHDEEAKAYAFSLFWMNTIKKYNIANLGDAIITEHPAENGLHNVSFAFVHQLLAQGKEAEEIYDLLIAQELSLLSGS